MQARIAGISVLVAALFSGGLFLSLLFFHVPYEAIALPLGGREEPAAKEPFNLVLAGDVMLARDVERRLLEEERGYALSFLEDRLRADMTLVNFESSIPAVHQPTQNMEMRFSVRPELLAELSLYGVTHLSLANNHSLDHGESGYRHTKDTLAAAGFAAAGHPVSVSTSSVFQAESNGRQIVVVNINATYHYPTQDSIESVLPTGLEDDDFLIAYIHWGEEYELTHNQAQATFGHRLIDSGFDLVVGHHPHVTQDIERYQDGLIFYSLGNFIFDQYWRPEVRQGLLLDVLEGEDGWQIELVPVESQTAHVQPREMVSEAKAAFLYDLAKRSSKSLAEDIAKGSISLQF